MNHIAQPKVLMMTKMGPTKELALLPELIDDSPILWA